MKNTFILIALLALTFTNSNAYSTKIITAHAIGIFHENGNGENVQHLRKTKDDYNGICFSKIVVFGNLSNIKAKVKIGNSIGSFVKTISIYNKQKIKIAQEMTYKHYNVTKGYTDYGLFAKVDGPRNNKIYIISGFSDPSIMQISWFMSNQSNLLSKEFSDAINDNQLSSYNNFEMILN